ncbi:Uncharacterised protein [Amycolatopsis camponoti]|uniref:Uncharacterized protein n=1 Tax=Amycolatopsis camponoti TaxID=2606593 RepID=A0A6I8LI47_9PSEU|nr:hypothetical protein [Amycolatopsis camponoti]VVJ16642.1 Uncharacterised protein [Amycolatopsis camponoti]
MQNSQVPIWIPIVVAILGVAGVVVGQVINAWRDARIRRYDLERERLKLTHDDTLDWRKMRVDIYGTITGGVNEFLGSYDPFVSSHSEIGTASSRLDSVTKVVHAQLGKVEIVGSAETSAQLKSLSGFLRTLRFLYLQYPTGEGREADAAMISEIARDSNDLYPRIESAARQLNESFRRDLGIPSTGAAEHPPGSHD